MEPTPRDTQCRVCQPRFVRQIPAIRSERTLAKSQATRCVAHWWWKRCTSKRKKRPCHQRHVERIRQRKSHYQSILENQSYDANGENRRIGGVWPNRRVILAESTGLHRSLVAWTDKKRTRRGRHSPGWNCVISGPWPQAPRGAHATPSRCGSASPDQCGRKTSGRRPEGRISPAVH